MSSFLNIRMALSCEEIKLWLQLGVVGYLFFLLRAWHRKAVPSERRWRASSKWWDFVGIPRVETAEHRPRSNWRHYYAQSSFWCSVPDLYWKQHPGSPAPTALHVAFAHAFQNRSLRVQSTLCHIRLIHTYLTRVFSHSYFEADVWIDINLILICTLCHTINVIGVGEGCYRNCNVTRSLNRI